MLSIQSVFLLIRESSSSNERAFCKPKCPVLAQSNWWLRVFNWSFRFLTSEIRLEEILFIFITYYTFLHWLLSLALVFLLVPMYNDYRYKIMVEICSTLLRIDSDHHSLGLSSLIRYRMAVKKDIPIYVNLLWKITFKS